MLRLRVAVLGAVLLAFNAGIAPRARADEPDAAERVSIEVSGPAEPIYVGEPFTLRIRILLDRAFFDAHAVPLFRQAMDLPVQLTVPWLLALDGAAALDGGPATPDDGASSTLRSLALGDAVVALEQAEDERRDGRAHIVLLAERRFVVEAPGPVAVPGAALRFAHASRFKEDFVGGRVAIDRADVTVRSLPLALDVRALPAQGRPAAFAGAAGGMGAVGSYTASATAEPTRVALGESLTLTVVIEGDGNLALIGTPRFEPPGFHVYGAIDDKHGARRTIRYELAPTEAVHEVPRFTFSYFDPARGQYDVARSDPIAIEVVGAPAAVPEREDTAPTDRRSLGWMWMLFGLFGLYGVVWVLRRRRGPEPAFDAAAERVRQSDEDLRVAIKTPDVDRSEAFAAFLAAHLGCPRSAVIGGGLEARLIDAGVAADAARDAAHLMEQLVAARYGGGAVIEVDPTWVDLFSTRGR